MRSSTALLAVAVWIGASAAFAQAQVTQAKASFIFIGERVKISRDNTLATRFAASFTSSGEDCGAPCIAPMQVTPDVPTLGAREFDGIFNLANGRALLVYDRGPASDDAGALVRNLLAAGYPAEKIRYYRGGMQVWSVLGFSMEVGTS